MLVSGGVDDTDPGFIVLVDQVIAGDDGSGIIQLGGRVPGSSEGSLAVRLLGLDLAIGTHPDGYDVWRHRDTFATRANVGTLQARGVSVLGPGEGEQACGETGEGRMMEPDLIVDALRDLPTA